MPDFPRISFGMIVLNGEPFVRYNLQALYPFAHQIIVVEGAVASAAMNATAAGHSRDSTLATLYQFKAEEDPENKLIIVTRDGFWHEKDAMSQAYAERATGDYLWQVDSDEFYQPEGLQTVINLLQADPTISGMSFRMITFWGAPQYTVDGWYLRRGAHNFHRLFKWGAGYTYTTHRPPTIYDDKGRDVQTLHWLSADNTQARGIYLYHYSLLFPKQVLEKSAYYQNVDWGQFKAMEQWASENYMALKQPFRVHNVYQYPSWLEHFAKPHPPQIRAMWDEIQSGKVVIQVRDNADVEALLKNPLYHITRFFVKHIDLTYPLRRQFTRFLRVQQHRLRSLWRKIVENIASTTP
jgi:hypothetical protein